MSTTTSTHRHPAAIALAGVHAALDEVADAAVWSLDDSEIEAAVDECERAAARLADVRLRLVAEADARDLGRRLGASSTAAWLRDRFRIRLGHARALVEAAGRIAAGAEAPEAPADFAADVSGPSSGREMPATGKALAAGEVSEAHAVVISKAMGKLPDGLDAADGAEAERQFVALARQYDPGTLATMIDCLIEALAPETLEAAEEEAIARRELRLSEHTGRVSGRFDPEALAMIRAMLDPLAAPQSDDDGARDQRTPARRMADALVEITRRVLGRSDWLPARHGARPHLTLITELNPDCGAASDTGFDSDPSQATSARAGSPATIPGGATAGDAARRPAPVAVADADASPGSDPAHDAGAGDRGGASTSAPGGTPPGHPPGGAPSRPRLGRGEPTWGRPLSAGTVERLACDAGLTWIITDPTGVPLNVSREHRTVTPAQWAALIVRDGGCVFPGCTRSVEWCEAHHIVWWRFGGTTDLDNLCLLCSHHHRVVHHGGWDIRVGADRQPQFVPPPWVDSRQTPRRNNRPRYYRNRSPG